MAQDSGHNLAGSPALAVKVLARAGAHLKDQLEKDQLPGHVVFGSIRFPADCWTKGLSFWLTVSLLLPPDSPITADHTTWQLAS